MQINKKRQVIAASLIGTSIEYYDFYIFGTATALVLGLLFFPGHDESAQLLKAFASFSIAFLARPLGSALFGHYGDKWGRKSTLVFSLLLMGVATTLIGVLPTYAEIGFWAPLLLCVLRFAQGLGLGGEWGGAALLATENAPPQKRALFGMFPQLGAPLGFILANGLFLVLVINLTEEEFMAWGWRIPFLLSAVLLALGLYWRLNLLESPAFQKISAAHQTEKFPLMTVIRDHKKAIAIGAVSMMVCYALFYIATVFALSYGVSELKFSRTQFLSWECLAIIFMALAIPLSALLADKIGRKPVLISGTIAAMIIGLGMQQFFVSKEPLWIITYISLCLFTMGWIFAPMGAFLPELFPTNVRYTGASVAYNLGGILGASFAPALAQILVKAGGLSWVGFYITAAAILSFVALYFAPETRDQHQFIE